MYKELLATPMTTSTTTIFILQLEHGKYYVGESQDPIKALEEHREGLGPFWTKIHRPIRIIQTVPFKQREDLNNYTKLAMRKYGLENVRGGIWEAARLSDAERHALHDDATSDDIMCCIA